MSQQFTIDEAVREIDGDDVRKIHRIAMRAAKELSEVDAVHRNDPTFDILSCEMDLTVVHATVGLRLDDLIEAEPFNFWHDISGIERHLNRDTGELENCFLPRYAAPQRIDAEAVSA